MSLHFPMGLYRPPLKAFLGLSNDDRVKLVKAFEDTGLVTSVGVLTAEVSRRMSMPASALEPVVRAIVSLAISNTRAPEDPRTFAQELIQAACDDRQLKDVLPDPVEPVVDQIAAILSCDRSVRRTAKALDISGQSERVVSESRIISDIRPVFGDRIEEKALHAVILHTLRLECHGEFQHHHFLLSSQALRELKAVVERAVAKEDLLVRTLQADEGLRVQVFADAEEP